MLLVSYIRNSMVLEWPQFFGFLLVRTCAARPTPAAHVQQGLEEWSSANLGAMIILGGVHRIVGFCMI